MKTPRHILSVDDMSFEFIRRVIETSFSMLDIMHRDIKKVPTLRGKMVVNLFFEPSTRTRTSFELAAKALSADITNFSVSSSSVVKGESFLDTIKTIETMGADVIVVRQSSEGAAHFVASAVRRAAVINGGDGCGEHPTQALLDLFSIIRRKGFIGDWRALADMKVIIVGDILHSRVARSDIKLFKKVGMKVGICGPYTMIPYGIEEMGVDVFSDLREAIKDADIIMPLRLQLERQKGALFPNAREYSEFWGLTQDVLSSAPSDAVVMHPGPTNLGVEIFPDVAYSDKAIILNQVESGVAVRMTLLYTLLVGAIE
jgi:aspartate carbamoyltransferase catalytic subunit